MTDETDANPPSPASVPAAVPEPLVTKKNPLRLSLVWIVPILAVIVGASLLLRSFFEIGPHVVIEFRTAEGLEPGKTQVRYKEVVIGHVDTVSLSSDRQRVLVGVQLVGGAAGVAVDDTLFWVVRPRIGTAGVSGLGTFFSGAYIGVDAGVSQVTRRNFVGLEVPPYVLRGEPGRRFVLHAKDLGSLDVGSPIYYRRARVGRVVGYALDPQADELQIQIFIEAPYESLVTQRARFWNASGLDVTLNASGLTLNAQTLASVITGGIAFERLPAAATLPAAPAGSPFYLFHDRKTALAAPDGPPFTIRMVFDQSVRGLAIGAPVDFLGIEIGNVRSMALLYDKQRQRFPMEVTADIYPLRLGAVRNAMLDSTSAANTDTVFMKKLVERGLRAQVRTANLLTGQQYVALDFIAKAAPATLDTRGDVPIVPTVPGTLSELQPQLAEIVGKLSKVPFDDIGEGLQATLSQARSAIAQLTPEAQKALADVQKTLTSVQETLARLDRNLLDSGAPVQRNVEQTLNELQRAAQSLRVLGDYLQRHPESMLRGKPADAPMSGSEKSR